MKPRALDWFARDQTYEFLGAFVVMASVVNVIAQVAGVLMAVRGIGSPQRRLIRNEEPTVSLMPGAVGAPLGASLAGSF